MEIRIIVAGASGKMGQETIRLLSRTPHFRLVGATSRKHAGKEVGNVVGTPSFGVHFKADLAEVIDQVEADVLVDFTTPELGKRHIRLALESGIRPVMGTTGFTEQEIAELSQLCKDKQLGAIIAPNFAIGAVLMMDFAKRAARYLPHVEIIESHHDQKLDAPSGTSMKTAELIANSRKEVRQGHPDEVELREGARGAYYDGFRIHSIRLPGMVAHQEVLFGGTGQLLTIRHDSYNRESFMPGVQLATEKVMELSGLVYGLENILQL